MKTSNALVLILVLLSISASTEWPTHTVCKEDNLEIHYKSCDPQQDFAFSIDRCSDVATHTFNVRAAMVLRHSIKELYVKADLIIGGKTVLSYSDTLCEPGHSQLIFCGKKKGGCAHCFLSCHWTPLERAWLPPMFVTEQIRSYHKSEKSKKTGRGRHWEVLLFSTSQNYQGITFNKLLINTKLWDTGDVSEHLYYEGPVTLGIKEIPQGDYTVSARLTNEDHVTIACADFTVKNYLDYY